jgi:formylglycine-generating enzyme required for sulfatase activity
MAVIFIAPSLAGDFYEVSSSQATAGAFSATGLMTSPRSLHTANLLTDGRVLLAGGVGAGGSSSTTLASAELYDPITRTFGATSAMPTPRLGAASVRLNDGRVFMAGGEDASKTSVASVGLYNPVAGTWTLTSPMKADRVNPTATLLGNGQVLVVGGYQGNSDCCALASAELYDPKTGTFSDTGSMATARRNHTATLLEDGKVLIAGGYDGSYLDAPELYDPATGTFSVKGSMGTSRRYPTATLLLNGDVLIAGGSDGTTAVASAELYEASGDGPVKISTVAVSNPGNAVDTATQVGAVDHEFRMGQFDITIGQYTAFLNAVGQSDPHGLYNPKMATDLQVAGIARTGSAGKFRYSVIPPSGPIQVSAATPDQRPITYVSWFDAARFANWMTNGQPSGRQTRRTTENGAYNLLSTKAKRGLAVPKNTVNPNTGSPPIYFLPTENEWYKAAYYNPALNNNAGGYTLYSTNSNSAPTNTPGSSVNAANLLYQGKFAITQQISLDSQQNYSTDVGSFTHSKGPYGTYDMNGSIWEMIDPATQSSPSIILRGGGWTSYFTYLQSSYRIGGNPAASGLNGGLRLISEAKNPAAMTYELVKVGHPGNRKDKTGFGAVNKTFWIGKYEVTIGEYCAFLNAVAKTDPYGLYDPAMTNVLNSAGVQRSGSSGNYTYAPMNNAGDSSRRPISFISWFDAARYANWMSNGQPIGTQDSTTTEDGAYRLQGVTQGATVVRNPINPNTGAAPMFFMPTEDQWYKAAYFSQKLNSGRGGYYLYATRSNRAPGNRVGDEFNMANYIDDYSGSYFYCVSQARFIDPSQNYLTDVGAYSGSSSFYRTYDQNGLLYQWNDLDGTAGPSRGLRGGFYFAGPGAAQSLSFNQASPKREAGDTTIRLAAPM